jgi:hypothetical protein
MRKELNDEQIILQIEERLASPEQFGTVPQNAEVKAAFTKLRNIAAAELQNSLLATRCWQKAVVLLR